MGWLLSFCIWIETEGVREILKKNKAGLEVTEWGGCLASAFG